MPALDVAPEKGGIHECLVTQMALHRGGTIGRTGLDPPDSMGLPCIENLPPRGPWAASETNNLKGWEGVKPWGQFPSSHK